MSDFNRGDFVRVIREPTIPTPWLAEGTIHQVAAVVLWAAGGQEVAFLKLVRKPSVWAASRFVRVDCPYVKQRQQTPLTRALIRALAAVFAPRSLPKSWRKW